MKTLYIKKSKSQFSQHYQSHYILKTFHYGKFQTYTKRKSKIMSSLMSLSLSFSDSQFMANCISSIIPSTYPPQIILVKYQNHIIFSIYLYKDEHSFNNIFMTTVIYLSSNNNSLMIFIFKIIIVLNFLKF